jgi:enterochelin esterase-like enzyme
MAPELLRAIGRRWLSLLAAGCLLVAGARPGTAWARPWPEEFPWLCTQSSGQMITLTVASTVYQRPVAASVYLPPCYDWTLAPIPAVYLLHGANTDQTQWPDVGVQAAADALIAQGTPPFAVVMPGGPYLYNVDYEAFVLRDLIPGIEARLRVSQAGSGRAIGGISLGGYWALKTAFEHPDLFAAVGGHSPVTIHTAGPDDPAALASSAPGLDRLRITLDVGDMDSLRASTEQLAGTLRARALAVTLNVNHGGHDRPYWRAHTADYLRFYTDALAAPA